MRCDIPDEMESSSSYDVEIVSTTDRDSLESAENNMNLGITEQSGSESDNENNEANTKKTLSRVPFQISSVSDPAVYGTVNVTNSSEVHFGTKTVIHGPVTIKQIVGTGLGFENNGYIKSEDESGPNGVGKANVAEGKNDQGAVSSSRWMIRPQWILILLLVLTVSAVLITLTIIFVERSQDSGLMPTVMPDFDPKCNISVKKSVYLDTSDVLLAMSLAAILLVGIVVLVLRQHSLDVGAKTVHRVGISNTELLPNSRLRYVTRTQWIAQPVEEPLDPLKLPARWVIIAHTATENCTTQSECVYVVRNVQTYHIESRKWSDIGYNFLVGGDGSAYIGRGWNYVGAHTMYYNSRSIGIAFIGTFNNIDPPSRQVLACQQLIEDGITLGKIAKDYKLFGHRQLMSTLSPGDKVYSIIQKWPHWSDNNTDSN